MILQKLPTNLCFVLAFCLFSCTNSEHKTLIADDFSSLNEMWNTQELTNESRAQIVDDITDKNNSVIKFDLFPNDFNAGGKRNEFKLATKDSIGSKVTYSFQFMFPEQFFVHQKKQDWIMIHQWHDKPPKGVSWANYNMQTKPPVQLYMQTNPDGKYYIVYAYGLWNKEKKLIQHIKVEKPLEALKWYTFENTIFWGNSDIAYSIPKINNEYLIDSSESEEHKIQGANMYNTVPNYFKIGLYGNNLANDTISVYLDNFKYFLSTKK